MRQKSNGPQRSQSLNSLILSSDAFGIKTALHLRKMLERSRQMVSITGSSSVFNDSDGGDDDDDDE